MVHSLVVPGLLQTEAYARTLTGASRVWQTPDQIDGFVELRMQRQQLLDSDSPPRLWVVLSDLSIRQEVGGRAVLAAQLDHLVEAARRPHVTVQVLPFASGAHAGTDGRFALMRFPVRPDVVCVEAMRASLYLEEPEDVELYATTRNHLKSSALSTRDSMSYLRDLSARLGT